MKTKIVGALSFVVGAGMASAVWFVASLNRPLASGATSFSETGANRVTGGKDHRRDARGGDSPRQWRFEENNTGQPSTLAECESQLSLVREAVQDCSRELNAQTADKEFEQGKAIPFPPQLDDKFKREALVSAMTDAFKEAAVKGEVQVADCSEYPCVACGNLGDDVPQADINALIGDARKVAGTKPLSIYKDTAKKGDVFTYQVEGTSLERTLFCQAFYPKPTDEALAEEITKRLTYRFERIKDALR